MYSFNLVKKNLKNPIKFRLFKLKNINSINTSLKSSIISRIYKNNYQCGCGRK
jgi:hypothetical protein